MTTTLYGAEVSYFTGKVRSYLRWAGIPFQEVSANADVYKSVILPAVGVPVIPVLKDENGHFLQDSTVIIDTLDARQVQAGRPSVYPSTPLRKLVALLFEIYGDEWLVIPAMHFRWHYDKEWAMREFGALNAPDASPEVQLKIGRKLAKPFAAAAEQLGTTADMIGVVEDSCASVLAELDVHFCLYPALLGNQATMADFGLIGPLYAHLYRDPTGNEIMHELAPNLVQWVERVQFNPEGLRAPLEPGDRIPETLLPLLRRQASEQLPVLVDTAHRVRAWMAEHPGEPLPRVLGTHTFELEGRHGERIVRPYSLWMVQRIRDHLASLNDTDRSNADVLLRFIGADALIDFPDPPRLALHQLSVKPAG